MTEHITEIIPPSFESLEPTNEIIISNNGRLVQLTPDSPTIPAGDYFSMKSKIEKITRQHKFS